MATRSTSSYKFTPTSKSSYPYAYSYPSSIPAAYQYSVYGAQDYLQSTSTPLSRSSSSRSSYSRSSSSRSTRSVSSRRPRASSTSSLFRTSPTLIVSPPTIASTSSATSPFSSFVLSLCIVIPIISFILWVFLTLPPILSLLNPPAPLSLRQKRIVLLIAHPDDEAMFFSPTLMGLTDPALSNHVKLLCFSTGNADGLGKTRSKELITSAVQLGLRRPEDVFIMDDQRFQDGMGNSWDAAELAKVLAEAFTPLDSPARGVSRRATPEPKLTPTTTASKKADNLRRRAGGARDQLSPREPTPDELSAPKASIDVLVTFDEYGISSHPNHISLNAGAKLFLRNLMRGHERSGVECPVQLYTLPTVGLLRKYGGVVDVVVGLLSDWWSRRSAAAAADAATAAGEDASTVAKGAAVETKTPALAAAESETDTADSVTFINNAWQYWRARNAMVHGHVSQMVWFRWGWITLGRYMVVNDLKREKIGAEAAPTPAAGPAAAGTAIATGRT